MRRNAVIAVVAVLLLSVGSYFLFEATLHAPQGSFAITQTKQAEEKKIPTPISSFQDANPIVFVSPKGDTVSFSGTVMQARNPGSNLYVGETKVAEVEGMGIATSSFSANGEFFSFETMTVCGMECADFERYTLDIPEKELQRAKSN